MAFGGRQAGRAIRALWGAVLSLCLLASPAFAQHGNGDAGRVPIEGVPTALQDDLKQLQRDEPAPSSLFEARRQAERAAQVVATFLESQGYYQAEVEPFAEGVDTFTRGVTVTPGPLFTYASAKIDYLENPPDDTTRIELESLLAILDPGIPARAQPVIETGDGLIARLRNAGYPDAKQDPVDALADAETSTVELTFKVRSGLRASFGKLSVSGLVMTNEKFIENLKPWKPGELVTPAKLDEFRSRLAQTGLFSTAAARLSTDGEPAANGQAPRDVVVEVKERERRTIALGASASTSDGVGVDGKWELRNYSGWGDSLAITGQIATLQRSIGATYTLPHIGKYGRILTVGTEAEDIETDAYDQTGANISASLEEQITPRVRAALGVKAGYAHIIEEADADTETGGRRDLIILSGSASAEYIGVRDILEPLNGVRARAAIEPGLTAGDTNIVFARLSGEASIYSDFGTEGDFVGALRGRLGTIVGPNGAPPEMSFFAGGGGSVRGYEYQSLSPRKNDILTGGRSLVEMSAEVRYRATDTLGYVAFLDAGAAGDNVEPPIDSMSFGAGVGVRYYTGFGPLRADIAVPLNKKDGDADFQIYISIGQAF
jgi:translocation and assembly module TamA